MKSKLVLQHGAAFESPGLALILDENPRVRVILTDMLKHAGLRTAAVSNFADVRLAVSQRTNEEAIPIVFVSSAFAPDVAAEISSLLADVPPPIVIVICAEHGGPKCPLFDKLRCGEYLRCMCKPFTYQQLLQRIKTAIHE